MVSMYIYGNFLFGQIVDVWKDLLVLYILKVRLRTEGMLFYWVL